jgi:ABC-type nitrate/sulfonate/bicarbonate transport system substrate-binding protein
VSTTLTTVTRTQGNNAALKDGSVVPRGYVLDFEEVPVLVQAFRRMVRGLEFDVSEMAVTTYLCANAHGVRFTALPVFLVRGFHHGAIAVTRSGDVRRPEDLEGRRVGVNRGYTVTTGVWARAILQEEHGIDLDRVTWVLSGDEHVAEYQPPANVVPLEPGRSLEELLLSGELAAVVGAEIDHPDVGPLIPDPEAAARTALRERGFYPINHLVVVKDDVLEAHPDVADAVYDAFAEAKDRYVGKLLRDGIDEPSAADRLYLTVLRDTGTDPLPYGLEPNRPVLENLMDHAVRQHILDKPVPLESLFAGPLR